MIKEFSKKIFLGIAFATVVITLFTLAIIWKTNDTSPLMYLIPAIYAELATATGYYFWKAKL